MVVLDSMFRVVTTIIILGRSLGELRKMRHYVRTDADRTYTAHARQHFRDNVWEIK